MRTSLLIATAAAFVGTRADAATPRPRIPSACAISVEPTLRLLTNVTSDEERLSVLTRFAAAGPVGVCQALCLVPRFSWSVAMLRAVEILAPAIADHENVEQIVGLFPLPEDRELARRLLRVR